MSVLLICNIYKEVYGEHLRNIHKNYKYNIWYVQPVLGYYLTTSLWSQINIGIKKYIVVFTFSKLCTICSVFREHLFLCYTSSENLHLCRFQVPNVLLWSSDLTSYVHRLSEFLTVALLVFNYSTLITSKAEFV